jgi:hypothetical protein
MRQKPPPTFVLGQQLAEWHRPLDDDPEVEEAVTRMVRALDYLLHRDPRDRNVDSGFSPSGAD